MKNKKALSTIVATLLIILLTVVAVVVVWQILKPMLTNTANQIGTKCITTEVSIKSCAKNSTIGLNGINSSLLTVSVDKGSPDKIRIITFDSNGDSVNVTEFAAPATFASKTFSVFGDSGKEANSANIVAIYNAPAGSTTPEVCDATYQTPKVC